MPAAGAPDARGKLAAIAQVDREFVPYMTVLQTGTTVTFPNRDPIQHHVYSFSPAKSFEIKLYSGKSPSEILFDKPGVVTLGCNIHDWMIGYMLVVSTPYFAKTDAGGIARLRDVPARQLRGPCVASAAARRGELARFRARAGQRRRGRVQRSTSCRARPSTSRRSTG